MLTIVNNTRRKSENHARNKCRCPLYKQTGRLLSRCQMCFICWSRSGAANWKASQRPYNFHVWHSNNHKYRSITILFPVNCIITWFQHYNLNFPTHQAIFGSIRLRCNAVLSLRCLVRSLSIRFFSTSSSK